VTSLQVLGHSRRSCSREQGQDAPAANAGPVESPRTLLHSSCSQEPPADDRPRRRIARATPQLPHGPPQSADDLALGRYRMLERLGAGGFGEVWRAQDELLRREVAVKRIWLGADGGPIDGERAAREALAAARLCHPAIVALYEACAVGDAFYLITELVHGQTLARMIAERSLTDEHALQIGLAIAGALAHAHARGVIHRDVKPQNVLVPSQRSEPDGAAKLTDFGGASLAGEDALTRTGDVLGTLAYMAPEQSEGREAGAQADLYALALVLYESLSGVNPVRGPTPAATARRIGRALEPLSRRRPDLPRELGRALDGALSPAPDRRGTLEDLHAALQDSADQGLQRSRLRRRRMRPAREATLRHAHTPVPLRARAPQQPPMAARDQLDGAHEREQPAPARFALPRAVWVGCACAAILWQALSGRAGVALVALAAFAPLAILPAQRPPARLGAGWLAGALAPALGLAGLAGAYPALAGQASRWRQRASLGALGYWWLLLAEPLLARRLWLGLPAGTPRRAVWEHSLSSAAVHVVVPMLTVGALLGALLWASGAAVLPWIVRGRSAALDLVLATMWSAAIAAAAPALDAGLSSSHPSPRGAVLGAVLAGALAIGARALRGPA
jgi:eukaryotic-like serine/threonine-protein kinase